MNKKRLISAVLTLVMVLTLVIVPVPGGKAQAANQIPLMQDNLSSSNRSTLIATATGYSRVFSDGSVVWIENYNSSFDLLSKQSVKKEMDLYGGCYAGKDANYLVFAQHNTEQNTAKVIMRVVKYSKTWSRLGVADITGSNDWGEQIRYMFDLGYPDMAEYSGTLYIACGHEGYVDPDYNQGHQGFLLFAINESTMKGEITDADYLHSFSQDLAVNGSNVFILEESEGSEYAKVSKINTSTNKRTGSFPVLRYGGERTSAWAVATYATADDIEISSSKILTVGTSIDQANYGSGKPYNVYLTSTPISNPTEANTTFKWVTTNGTTSGFKGVHLTKINNNRFLLSWESAATEASVGGNDLTTLSKHVLHYRFVDGNGNLLGSEYKAPAPYSNCNPIVNGSKVVFCASDGANLGFYTIDTSSGAFTKKVYAMAGPTAFWSYANGTLTVSGSGEIYENFVSKGLASIKNDIKKVVIKSGITKISDRAFYGMQSLEEVVIESGVKTIGAGAFGGTQSLKKTTIPTSVTSIADDAFHTGYYWIGSGNPVIYTTIICEQGSYADTYARNKSIRVENQVLTTTPTSYTSPSDVDVNYRTHIQNVGWESSYRKNGAISGTSGRSLRLEAINISVTGNPNLGVQYTTHCQDYGWLAWSANGEMNGTSGESKRLEAIMIKLTGSDAYKYDIYYRVHAQNKGWMNWAKNGEPAGTAGYAYRLEAIQIVVVAKGAPVNTNIGDVKSTVKEGYSDKNGRGMPQVANSDVVNVSYQTHVQNVGWQAWRTNGGFAGTSGRSLRLEGIKINLTNKDRTGGVRYRTHVQNIGWQNFVADGAMSGTSGRSLRLEAIDVELYGDIAKGYDVYYRVHAQNVGWMGWAANGAHAGTAGYGRRLEGIQIVLVKKGGAKPALDYGGIRSVTAQPYLQR